MGALVQTGEPNYALLSGATRTIQSLLDLFLSGEMNKPSGSRSNATQLDAVVSDEEWMPWANSEFWDFEADFWRNLADHPTLISYDPDGQPSDRQHH